MICGTKLEATGPMAIWLRTCITVIYENKFVVDKSRKSKCESGPGPGASSVQGSCELLGAWALGLALVGWCLERASEECEWQWVRRPTMAVGRRRRATKPVTLTVSCFSRDDTYGS